MATISPNDRPRAVLYNFGLSVWGSVATLGLYEKGYAADDLDIRVVDLTKGENYAPSFLRINPNGTVPTLVAPTFETTSREVATKFRAMTDSKSLLEFLDVSRSQPILQIKGEDPMDGTSRSAAAPMLAPATIEGKAISDALITLVHSDGADPNFLLLAVRSDAELQQKQKGMAGSFIKAK